ncbi:MAG: pyrrolo-quinoline quinone, partial [Thermoflexales bacterium]
SGNPLSAMAAMSGLNAAPAPRPTPDPAPVAQIDHAQARAWAGRMVTVTGTLRYVFNNGKQVLLGFSNPHQGSFKAIIAREHWANFPAPPEQRYRVGQRVAIVGVVGWYQGDPAIRVSQPSQLSVLK